MRISIIADAHLGYAYNSRLENDSFENFEEAIDNSLNSDIILIAGDIFNSRTPKTSVLSRAIKILRKALLKTSNVKLIETDKELHKVSERTLKALPIIALYGNHERRSRGEINIIQALENAGLLICLNRNYIIFEKNGIRVAIHGMSSFPERYAKKYLTEWDPKPIENCFNILMLHQSIYPYIFSPIEPPSLKIEDLPKGFDLIVNGHIHISASEKIGDSIFLVPGSTVITQMEENEAKSEKGFYVLEIGREKKLDFVPLKKRRKFFFDEIKIKVSAKKEIEEKIREILLSESFVKPPIIKLRIKGKEEEVFEQDLREIERKFFDKAIVIFSKELESIELTKKIEFIRNIIEEKQSIEEIGLNILRKNLEELNFGKTIDYEMLFNLLSEGEVEKTFNLLIGEQKTLFEFS